MPHQSRTTQSEGPVDDAVVRIGEEAEPPMGGVDAEFFRIINDEQLRDIRTIPPGFPAGVLTDVRARIWRGSPC
jgi:hypothetical protein